MANYQIKFNLLKMPGSFLTKDANGRFIVGIYVDTSAAYYLPEKSQKPTVYAKMVAWELKPGVAKGDETHIVKPDMAKDEGECPIVGNATPIVKKEEAQAQTAQASANDPFAGVTPPPRRGGFNAPSGWGI